MTRRYSKKREEILSVLKAEHGALSAAELHTKLPAMDLTTIYRNLERFVADGEVKKLILNGKEALYEYQAKPHHHAVCTECERVIHFTAPDEKIKELLGVKDFQVDELEVTVRGICKHKH
jgi:Fur family transcriptional regulator, ferric uptake regulator